MYISLLSLAVRGFVTGSTSTSLWTVYNKGVHNYCGIDLPDGKDADICMAYVHFINCGYDKAVIEVFFSIIAQHGTCNDHFMSIGKLFYLDILISQYLN